MRRKAIVDRVEVQRRWSKYNDLAAMLMTCLARIASTTPELRSREGRTKVVLLFMTPENFPVLLTLKACGPVCP